MKEAYHYDMDIFVKVAPEATPEFTGLQKFLRKLSDDFAADPDRVTVEVAIGGDLTFQVMGADTDALGPLESAVALRGAWDNFWTECFGDMRGRITYASFMAS
jgi:hypothetical protein